MIYKLSLWRGSQGRDLASIAKSIGPVAKIQYKSNS